MSKQSEAKAAITTIFTQMRQAAKIGDSKSFDASEKKLDKAFTTAMRAGVPDATIERLDARTPQRADFKGDATKREKEKAKEQKKGKNPRIGKGGGGTDNNPTFPIYNMMKRPDLPKLKKGGMMKMNMGGTTGMKDMRKVGMFYGGGMSKSKKGY